MGSLDGKVAIITGASSGIGYAAATLFAGEGAKVIVTARRRAELDRLVAEITAAGGQAIAVPGDVKDESLAKALVDTATKRFGGLDIAFNNAGSLGEMGPVYDLSLSGWHETLETNLTSAFLGAKYQVPAMIARGGGPAQRQRRHRCQQTLLQGASGRRPGQTDQGACRRPA